VAVTAVKSLVASLVMGAAAWATDAWLVSVLPGGATPHRLVRVCVSIGAALVVLAASTRALRLAEFDQARRLIAARLTGGASPR
jgi:peptidoglycan biosynthesis protein MviN/MurJ (putative lipid II flippase)